EEPHNERVRFVESADIASPRFVGDFVADYAVNCAHEVADHIGPLGAGWREPQIAAVGNSQFLRQNGWRRGHRCARSPAADPEPLPCRTLRVRCSAPTAAANRCPAFPNIL